MVMMLQPGALKLAGDRAPGLSPEQRSRIAVIADRLFGLLLPLTRVTSRSECDALLADAVVTWQLGITELLTIFIASAGLEALFDVSAATPDTQVQQLAEVNANLFIGDTLEQFLGAYESNQALGNWSAAHLQRGGDDARLAAEVDNNVGTAARKASIALMAIALVLNDQTTDWRPEAIPILCAAADDNMTRVEDVFDSLTHPTVVPDELTEYRRAN